MLTTPLYDCHRQANALMIEFANTMLPVRFRSEREEHLDVRNKVGMFDVSHMGEFLVTGPDAASFLNYVLTSNVMKHDDGTAHYSLLLNHDGGVIDDLIVYRFSSTHFLLCVNAANINKDLEWLNQFKSNYPTMTLTNVSNNYAQIALQGPEFMRAFSSLTDEEAPTRFRFKEMTLAHKKALVAHTGYTGEKGVEIFLDPNDAITIWQHLLNIHVTPCGLAARDSLRLEAGMLLCGTDMDENTLALELPVGFAIDYEKTEFIGKVALVKFKQQGAQHKLLGLRLNAKAVPRHGYMVVGHNGEQIGRITSGGLPPTQPTPIALASINKHEAIAGKEVFVVIREKKISAILQKPRFLDPITKQPLFA